MNKDKMNLNSVIFVSDMYISNIEINIGFFSCLELNIQNPYPTNSSAILEA